MDVKLFTHCIRCGRRLKTLEAQQMGCGKVCAEKMKAEVEGHIIKPLFISKPFYLTKAGQDAIRKVSTLVYEKEVKNDT